MATLFASGAAAQPVERLRIETGPREEIRRLQDLRLQKGLGNPDYQMQLERVKQEFGFAPRLRLSPTPDRSKKGLAPFAASAHALRPAPLIPVEPLKRTQERLAALGYLDPRVDVDGKFGLKTQKSVGRLQKDHGLPVTGQLDSATRTWLQPNPLRLRAEPNVYKLIVPEDLLSNLSARYRLLDAAGHVVFWGDDQNQLATELNRSLTGAGQPVYVEMQGYTADKAEALATSLRIRQRQIDPSVSIGVLPHFGEDPGVRQALFTRGIKLERNASLIVRIGSGKDAGRFQAAARFSVRAGQGLRAVSVRIVSATRELIAEFLELLHLRCPSDRFDEQRTLAEMVAGVRTELKKRHPGLTDAQLRVNIVDQFGNIDIGLLRLKGLFAWS